MNMIVQGFYPWTQNDRGILSLGLDYQTKESKDKMDRHENTGIRGGIPYASSAQG